MGISRLQLRLDQDVYQTVTKYLDETEAGSHSAPLSSASIFKYISNSNSTLKRQKKSILLGSVTRIVQAYNDEHRLHPTDSGLSDVEFDDVPVAEDDYMNQSIRERLGKTTTTWKNVAGSSDQAAAQSQAQITTKRQSPRDEGAASKRRKTTDKSWVSEPSGLLLEDLAGIDSVIDQLTELVAFPMLYPHLYLDAGIAPTRGVLLHGPPGCGKTALANAFANKLAVVFIAVSAPSLVGGMSGESEKSIRDLFAEAKKQAPCLVFLDEIDAIIPKRESAQREMEKRIVAQMLTCLDDLSLQKTGGKPVIVMAATNRPDSLDEAMRRAGRFNKEINMPVPDLRAREQILQAMTRKLRMAPDVNFAALARLTPGYVGADLGDLVSIASVISIKRAMSMMIDFVPDTERMQPDNPPGQSPTSPSALGRLEQLLSSHTARSHSLPDLEITQLDLTTSLSQMQPSSLREGFATVPSTTFDEIGGAAALRRILELAIIFPIKTPAFYAQVGISAPSGVLLWGPPGCGKTLLAKAVAHESGANFISVKGPELLNKYVGESEKAVRKLFERARSSVPVLVFFDELDALVPKREDSGNEASSRVVNTLLAELDGVGSARKGIYVMAATNRPDIIDQAILRPGRLDQCCFVDLPTRAERTSILTTVVKKRRIPVDPGLDLETLVALDTRTEGMSGADLVAVLKAAGIAALKRHYGEGTMASCVEGSISSTGRQEQLWLMEEDFKRALQEVKPSVNDIARYRALAKTLRFMGNG